MVLDDCVCIADLYIIYNLVYCMYVIIHCNNYLLLLKLLAYLASRVYQNNFI